MGKTISYQKRVKGLPFLTFIIILFVYWFAIGGTIQLRHETKLLETEALTIEKAPLEMANLRKQLDQISKSTGDQYETSGVDPLMELTSKLASVHQVTLSEYQPAHLFKYQNYTIESREVSFEAPFIPCLKVLYDLEKSYHQGKIVSVSYMAVTDNKTLKKHLTMKVLLQSIRNEKNNSNIDSYAE